MTEPERRKLYRLAVSRGYNCPSPTNHPKRFDLYIKTHQIEFKEPQSNLSYLFYLIGFFILCIILMLSI